MDILGARAKGQACRKGSAEMVGASRTFTVDKEADGLAEGHTIALQTWRAWSPSQNSPPCLPMSKRREGGGDCITANGREEQGWPYHPPCCLEPQGTRLGVSSLLQSSCLSRRELTDPSPPLAATARGEIRLALGLLDKTSRDVGPPGCHSWCWALQLAGWE